MIEALAGGIFLVTLVSRLVAMYGMNRGMTEQRQVTGLRRREHDRARHGGCACAGSSAFRMYRPVIGLEMIDRWSLKSSAQWSCR